METMVPLYAENELRVWERRARLFLAAGITAAAICLAACIALCVGVRPMQATRRLVMIISLNTLGGWLLILLTGLGYRPARAECRHLRHLAGGEASVHQGVLHADAAVPDIPGGIRVLRLLLTDAGGESVRLRLNARKRRLLPPDGTPVRVRCSGSFVTAEEVRREAR